MYLAATWLTNKLLSILKSSLVFLYFSLFIYSRWLDIIFDLVNGQIWKIWLEPGLSIEDINFSSWICNEFWWDSRNKQACFQKSEKLKGRIAYTKYWWLTHQFVGIKNESEIYYRDKRCATQKWKLFSDYFTKRRSDCWYAYWDIC